MRRSILILLLALCSSCVVADRVPLTPKDKEVRKFDRLNSTKGDQRFVTAVGVLIILLACRR